VLLEVTATLRLGITLVPLIFMSDVTHLSNVAGDKKKCVGIGFGPVAFVVFGLRLGHEAGGLWHPLASLAPTSLAYHHAEE
jgi:hypothetical protein